MQKEYRFIGKPSPRKDALEIVTGKAQFIDDMVLPRMLHGKVLRSPHPHANIKQIQTSRAENFPGVRAVLTHQNIPGWKTGMPRHVPVLDSKVRYVGDAVALVAADTEEIALETLNRIDVEYEELPAVYDVEEAIKPDAANPMAVEPNELMAIIELAAANSSSEATSGRTLSIAGLKNCSTTLAKATII